MQLKAIHKSAGLLILLSLLLAACGKKEEDERQKSLDMVTIRTLGLAYLEENKLTEAETEFKKLIELAPQEALGYANLGLVYLRMADYEKAEGMLQMALEVDSSDPEIRLNLAEIYELTQRNDQAISTLETTLDTSPHHMKTLYKLAQIHAKAGGPQSLDRAETFLNSLTALVPANIAVRLQLIETLLRNGKTDEATKHAEELQQQMPELPKESVEYFRNALQLMKAGKATEAFSQGSIFHNFMKVTAPYQAGLAEVRSSAGPLSGAPVLMFSRDISFKMESQSAILDAIRFTDATESSGLSLVQQNRSGADQSSSGAFAMADFDRDGDQDIYVSVWVPNQNRSRVYLFQNDFGRFTDIAAEAGLQHSGKDVDAIFADYDNDGFLDLFIANSDRNLLYRNVAEGQFQDVAASAGLAKYASTLAVEFIDLDQDGDLDIFCANNGRNLAFRNNLDGTFSELSERMGITGNTLESRNIAFADFDNDVDLDLLIINANGSNAYYRNLRQGFFEDTLAKSGIAGDPGSAVAVGDYDNDGFQDLFITAVSTQRFALYRNKGDGTFERDTRSKSVLDPISGINTQDTKFFDFDNDGFLDLLVVGDPVAADADRRAIFLFRNDGTGQFEDRSGLLPSDLRTANSIALADYNEDGDMDIFLATEGNIRLLRNDGGNGNKYLKVQLRGLRTGSGKNNHFGIGAKIEVRAGDLYQARVVENPVTHFGLGQRLKADVVRILWTNGVPENLFFPGSDQDLVEQQTLKGSCAFLYAWNGEQYEFVTDVMWRSALGMPSGIMGGKTTYAPAHSSNDYFRIPGESLKEQDGIYAMQLTEELWETAYFDQLRLISIDHPADYDVYIDERLAAAPTDFPRIYTISEQQSPRSAYDDQGHDLLSVIREKDDRYVSTFMLGRHQGLTESHDLVLDLGTLSSDEDLLLFLQGWLFPTDASINVALSQSDQIEVVPPHLQVPDAAGQWQTVIDNISFPMGKNKVVIIDLSDKFLSDDYRVRIRTNMQIYWDYVFYAYDDKQQVRKTELLPITADLHYRGFSGLYRKGGRYGPHWFDYGTVSTEPKWRDLTGLYTRYGDVLPLLFESDNKYVIMNAGDEISVRFDATHAGKLPKDWIRTFLIYTDGWIKDGDLNTAHGQTVEPLPFHGMTRYPYGPEDKYPENQELQEYARKYNTREVRRAPLLKLSSKN